MVPPPGVVATLGAATGVFTASGNPAVVPTTTTMVEEYLHRTFFAGGQQQ
jgi:hypothetical protein